MQRLSLRSLFVLCSAGFSLFARCSAASAVSDNHNHTLYRVPGLGAASGSDLLTLITTIKLCFLLWVHLGAFLGAS